MEIVDEYYMLSNYGDVKKYKEYYSKTLDILIKKMDGCNYGISDEYIMYVEMVKNLKEEEFKNFYNTEIMKITKKIKKKTVKEHTIECTICAIIDIFIKYNFDIETLFLYDSKCCTPKQAIFKKLQYDILTDISWYLKMQ